jgi:hypothetical protein
MFRINLRKRVLALSLFALTSGMLATAPISAASPVVGGNVNGSADVQQVVLPGVSDIVNAKMSIHEMSVTKNGRQTLYQFKLQADEGTLQNVQVTTWSSYKSIATHDYIGDSEARYPYFTTFSAPNYRHIWVDCNPPAGAYCTAAFVKARTQNNIEAWGSSDKDGNQQ